MRPACHMCDACVHGRRREPRHPGRDPVGLLRLIPDGRLVALRIRRPIMVPAELAAAVHPVDLRLGAWGGTPVPGAHETAVGGPEERVPRPWNRPSGPSDPSRCPRQRVLRRGSVSGAHTRAGRPRSCAWGTRPTDPSPVLCVGDTAVRGAHETALGPGDGRVPGPWNRPWRPPDRSRCPRQGVLRRGSVPPAHTRPTRPRSCAWGTRQASPTAVLCVGDTADRPEPGPVRGRHGRPARPRSCAWETRPTDPSAVLCVGDTPVRRAHETALGGGLGRRLVAEGRVATWVRR
jgi:hypothetical protein